MLLTRRGTPLLRRFGVFAPSHLSAPPLALTDPAFVPSKSSRACTAPITLNEEVCMGSISSTRSLIQSGVLSLEQVAEEHDDRISALNASYGVFSTVFSAKSAVVDRSVSPSAPAAGMFFSVKDDLWRDTRYFTTRGYGARVKIAESRIAACTSTPCRQCDGWCDCVHRPNDLHDFVKRLELRGAVMLGVTNVPQGYMSARTFSPGVRGHTRNACDPTLTVGGSTGGSAAAAQMGMGQVAFGSDAAGSIRLPAAFTGTIGIKSYKSGYASHAMPSFITRTVDDAAFALDMLRGDGTRFRKAVAEERASPSVVDSAKISLLPCLSAVETVQDHVITSSVLSFATRLTEAAGARVRILHNPWTPDPSIVGWRWSAGMFDEYGRELDGMERLGSSSPMQDFLLFNDPWFASRVKAWKSLTDVERRDHIQAFTDYQSRVAGDIEKVFKDATVLLTPATAVLPWPAELALPEAAPGTDAAAAIAVWNPYLPPFNFSTCVAATFPCGWKWLSCERALPIGMQLVIKHTGDEDADMETCLRWLACAELAFSSSLEECAPVFPSLRYDSGQCCTGTTDVAGTSATGAQHSQSSQH